MQGRKKEGIMKVLDGWNGGVPGGCFFAHLKEESLEPLDPGSIPIAYKL